jgi:hypothetical protein
MACLHLRDVCAGGVGGMTAQLDWLDLLEEHRAPYLDRAREAALKLLERRDQIHINHVREVCPPPAHIDPRVMGAVLKGWQFESTGVFLLSSRDTCHRRPIQWFRLSRKYLVNRGLV